jgi:hypothetical protein
MSRRQHIVGNCDRHKIALSDYPLKSNERA